MINALSNISFFKLAFIFIKLIGASVLAIIAILIILAILVSLSVNDD